MSNRSNATYPFNLIQDLLSLSDNEIQSYINSPPKDLDATLQYVLLQFLSEKERNVIEMYYKKEMTMNQIGKTMGGISKSTVSKYKAKAFRSLKSEKAKNFIQYGVLEYFEKSVSEQEEVLKKLYTKKINLISNNNEHKEIGKDVKIEELDLSVRAYNILMRAGIRYVYQIPNDVVDLYKLVNKSVVICDYIMEQVTKLLES